MNCMSNIGNADHDRGTALGRQWRVGRILQGLMDDVRVYNRVLSPGEIQSDMNAAV